jgi:hypothetical protein
LVERVGDGGPLFKEKVLRVSQFPQNEIDDEPKAAVLESRRAMLRENVERLSAVEFGPHQASFTVRAPRTRVKLTEIRKSGAYLVVRERWEDEKDFISYSYFFKKLESPLGALGKRIDAAAIPGVFDVRLEYLGVSLTITVDGVEPAAMKEKVEALFPEAKASPIEYRARSRHLHKQPR